MTSTRIRRQFLKVDGRHVHYLRAGAGSPVVLVHSSPANADFLRPQIERLAPRYTCFAFDTPGFGSSDPLPLATMEIADLADALARTLETIGMPPCPMFGTHTGAAIALEFARRYPARITGLVIDGIPSYTADEQLQLFEGYFAPLVVDALGGHYAQTWTRFRDQYIWFPWVQKRPENLNPIDLGPPESIHQWVMMFFRAAMHYSPAYRAAIRYGAEAIAAATELAAPAVFMTRDTDMLFTHLDRLPPLKADQTIMRLGPSMAEQDALIVAHIARFEGTGSPPPDPPAQTLAGQISRRFVGVPDGEVFVRLSGIPGKPPLLLLHDAPGSSMMHEPLISALAEHFVVIAPDAPGCGESEALAEGDRSIKAYAARIAAAARALGHQRLTVFGIGLGSGLALALADHDPALVAHVVIAGVLLPDGEERAELIRCLAPPIAIAPDGGHWYRTWLMLRDSLAYWPWYRGTKKALRRVTADFSAEHLHAWTFEVMKNHAGYHHVIAAVLDADLSAAVGRHEKRTIVIDDPDHRFAHYDTALRSAAPGARRLMHHPQLDAIASALAGLTATDLPT